MRRSHCALDGRTPPPTQYKQDRADIDWWQAQSVTDSWLWSFSEARRSPHQVIRRRSCAWSAANLSLDNHVISLSAMCFFQLQQLSRIRRSLARVRRRPRRLLCQSTGRLALSTCLQHRQPQTSPISKSWSAAGSADQNVNLRKPYFWAFLNAVHNFTYFYTPSTTFLITVGGYVVQNCQSVHYARLVSCDVCRYGNAFWLIE